MVDFEKLKRQLGARKMGRSRRLSRIGATRRRLEEQISAHRRAMKASAEAIASLEADIAKLDELKDEFERRGQDRFGAAPSAGPSVRLDLFDQATSDDVSSEDEALSLAKIASRSRSDDGFVWKSPLGSVVGSESAATCDPQLPALNEHLRRALTIPGYVHAAYAAERQWLGDAVLDIAARLAAERAPPPLALSDEFVGDALDRSVAMGRGAEWLERQKKKRQ